MVYFSFLINLSSFDTNIIHILIKGDMKNKKKAREEERDRNI